MNTNAASHLKSTLKPTPSIPDTAIIDKFYRSIHVSYPNAVDKAHAKKMGVNPGGDIMIHGQKNGSGHLASVNQLRDWTDGCIAVTDEEMDEIMAMVKVGTAIEIV
ncbi:MAG: L,D-transpeptidase family protein [Psychrobacter sp.]